MASPVLGEVKGRSLAAQWAIHRSKPFWLYMNPSLATTGSSVMRHISRGYLYSSGAASQMSSSVSTRAALVADDLGSPLLPPSPPASVMSPVAAATSAIIASSAPSFCWSPRCLWPSCCVRSSFFLLPSIFPSLSSLPAPSSFSSSRSFFFSS